MGNCCRRESAMVWASVDGWDKPEPRSAEKECLLGDAATPLQDQVKIKITKQELEELMATARVRDVPVERLLSRIINAVDNSRVQRQRYWEPSLHSIAE